MSDDRARARFIAIQALRWTGVAMVLIGLLAMNGRIDLPGAAGYVLVTVGLFDVLIMPTVLARRWRTPRR